MEIRYAPSFFSSSPYKNLYFTALFLNIRSLRNRINDLSAYVHTNSRKIDIIILNETRLKAYETHLFNIPGYHSFHSVRAKIGGGVSIFILKELSKANCLENFEFENSNFLIVSLTDLNMKVGGFYKPPDSNPTRFVDRLNSMLEKYNEIFCFGDFNLNLFEPNNSVRDYCEKIELNGHKLLNSTDSKMFTRCNLATGTKTCIDHIFTDTFGRFNYFFAIDDILNVDHKALLLQVFKPHGSSPKRKGKYIEFTKTDHETIHSSNSLSNVSTASFPKFIKETQEVIAAHTRTIRVKEKFRKSFMDLDIPNFMIIRQNYFKLCAKYPTCDYARAKYKFYRNLVVTKIRRSKRDHNDSVFAKNMNDPRKIWKHMNNILRNRDAKDSETCSRIVANGMILNNKFQIADEFNKFFSSVANDVKQNLSVNPLQLQQLRNIENYSIDIPFHLSYCSEKEIFDILTNLNSSDAVDCYGFSNNLLKLHKKSLSPPLTVLINKCLEAGDFPTELKTAVVKPIFKEGDKEATTNYRPIAILPILSKVFEYAILSRLSEHLASNNVLNQYQFGFVTKCNTEVAVLHLLSSIYNNIEKKKVTAAVFIDMKKAFDCVDHGILMNKFKLLMLPRNVENLLHSYMINRTQRVDIDGCRSGSLKVNSGIFQGSILGPISFIFYINGVFKLNLKGSIQLYADDIALVYGEKDPQTLKHAIESDLTTIRHYFNSLGLDINNSKTKYVQFQGRARLEYFTERSLNIMIGNDKLERVANYKYLGLFIDECLSFQPHISHIKKKIIPMIFAIRRIRYTISEKIAYQLYYSYVHSHIIFMNPLWSVANDSLLNQIFVLQKKCLRYIQMKDRLSPSIDLFSEKMLPLPVLNDYNLLILAFKIRHNLITNNVTTRYVNEIHNYGTRQRNNFHIIRFETNYGYADFYRRGLIKYNELNDDLKRFRTLGLFKRRLREFLYDQFEAQSQTEQHG